MTSPYAGCRVGPVSVGVNVDDPVILTYLREFYTFDDAVDPVAGWRFDVEVGTPDGAMSINRYGVGYLVDSGARRVRLRAVDPMNAAITARKCIREALIDFCEQRRYAMLHASAMADRGRVIIVVGDKGSGKTTLALKAALAHGMRYLSNDHLMIFRTAHGDGGQRSRLALTSLPTPIPVKIGTYLDLQDRLPPAWDDEGLDIDAYRTMPRRSLYGLGQRVLYTYRGLGQVNPQVVELPDKADPAVFVVLARYTSGKAGEPELVADPVAALMPHVRQDWMLDRSLNQRHLPRAERDPREYLWDARQLLMRLARRATVIQWDHCGDPAPLLADLPSGGRAQ